MPDHGFSLAAERSDDAVQTGMVAPCRRYPVYARGLTSAADDIAPGDTSTA